MKRRIRPARLPLRRKRDLNSIVDFSIIIANLGAVLGLFRPVDVELFFPKQLGGAYPARGPDIAGGLGLRSFLSVTFVACILAESL